MRKIYIYLLVALSCGTVNSQEYKKHLKSEFKSMSKPEMAIDVALREANLDVFALKASEDNSMHTPDSTVLFRHDKRSVKFEFTYNSKGSVTQVLYFLADSQEVWGPVQKILNTYDSDGSLATVTHQDASGDGWENYKKIEYNQTNLFYKEWKWSDGKWVGEESVEAIYNSENLPDTTYHGYGTNFDFKLKIGFSYYPNGQIKSEHLYELSEDKLSWEDKGEYIYLYDDNGNEEKIYYTDGEREYWKKEYKYTDDLCEMRSYDFIDNNWTLMLEELVRQDEGKKVTSWESYDYSSGTKTGAEHFENEYNLFNEIVKAVNYSWSSAKNEWIKDEMNVSDYDEEGYCKFTETMLWNGSAWGNQKRVDFIYDENKRLKTTATAVWVPETSAFSTKSELVNYYSSNATSNHPDIQIDSEVVPFVVNGKTISLNNSDINTQSFSVYDMRGSCIGINLKNYTFISSGTYIIRIGHKAHKVCIW